MQVDKKVKFKTIFVLSWVIFIYAIYPAAVYSTEVDKNKTIADLKPPFTFSIITLTPDGKPQPGVKIRCKHPRSERGENLVEMVVTSDAYGVAKFNVTQANLSLDRWFWFTMADENFVGPSGVGISPIDNEYTYTFKVLPAEKFQILVLDENDEPIPNAKLWLISDHPSFPAMERDVFETMANITADANGLAEVKFADVETNIIASADDFASEFVRGVPLPKDKPSTVKLSKGCTISGRVVDAENKPMIGVELSAKKKNFIMDYLDEFTLKTETDDRGNFILDKATEGEYEIQSSFRSPYEAYYAKPVSVKVDGTSASNGVKIVVEQGAVLRGKYLTRQQMRLSNRTIFVSTSSPVRSNRQVQTAEDGSFVISGIPQNAEGNISFIGVAGYYTSLKMNETYPFFLIDRDRISFRNVPPGTYEGVELEFLLSGCATGTIYDSSGNPASHYEFIVNPSRRIYITDDKGKYTADIPPNVNVTIEILDPSSNQVIYYVDPFRIEEGQFIEKDITIGAVSSKLVGKSLPDFQEMNIKVESEKTKDKMILVCFFDMEQRPSRHCINQLTEQAEQLKKNDITVILVHASKIEKEKLNEWIKENDITFPVGMIEAEEEKTKFDWGVKSLPWLILTDKNHIVTDEGFSINELTQKISILSSTNTKDGIETENESDVQFDVSTFDGLISSISSAERSLMNVKIEGELFQEERQSSTDPWKRNKVYVKSTARYSGKPQGKVRIDVHREILKWEDGTAPYAEESYSLGFDGQTGRRVTHQAGAIDDTFDIKEAEIFPDAPLELRSKWRDTSTGAAFSLYFLFNDQAMTTSEMLKIFKETDKSIEISREKFQNTDCIKISMLSGRRFYWFDLGRVYAFRGYQEVATDKEGHKVVLKSAVVSKVVEAAPGIWFPAEVTHLAAVGLNGPGLRNIFEASKVIANDPSFDEDVYKVPIPPDYIVHDRLSGIRYRSTGKEGNN